MRHVRVAQAWCGICGQNFERPDALAILDRHIRERHPDVLRVESAPPAGPSAEKIEALLAAHRRFHGKVGCPGNDCYVCQAEDAALDIPCAPETALREAAAELRAARTAVRDEMKAAAERGELRTNGQMPSWPQYERANRNWDATVEAFLEGERPQ